MKTKEEYLEKPRRMGRNVYLNGEWVRRDHSSLVPSLHTCGLTFELAGIPTETKDKTTKKK